MSVFTPIGSGGAPAPTPSGVVQSNYQTALAVASSATVQIISLMTTGNTYLLRLDVGGSNLGDFELQVGGTDYARFRTYWGNGLTGQIVFGSSITDAPLLPSGTNIVIQVTNPRPYPGDYEVRLQYIQD